MTTISIVGLVPAVLRYLRMKPANLRNDQGYSLPAPHRQQDAQTRLVLWNLLHGGGKRVPALVDSAMAHRPDICIFTESRLTTNARITELGANFGLTYHLASTTPPRKNGVLVMSRTALRRHAPPAGALYEQRWIEASLPEQGFRLIACHVPPKISIGVEQKATFWSVLLCHAQRLLHEPAMIVGDLNTGAPYRDEHRATLYCADQFEQLGALGWIDAWREFHGPNRKEWSWVYPRRRTYGYRLDHAFCTPELAKRLTGCRYSHDERERGLSDHSLMVVDLC
jgi:exodeoxyribonuclease-3